MARDRNIYQGADENWYNEDDQPICGRRRKNCDINKEGCGHDYTGEEHALWHCPECGKDRYCRMVVNVPGDACKFHGGASLKGAASGTFIHGKYSKYLPADLMSKFADFVEDPRKLSLENEMALIRALIADRIVALEQTDSAEAWGKMKRIYDEMMFAQRKGEKERFAQRLLDLGELIEEGVGVASTRKEIKDFVDVERRLVDTQRQVYVDAGEFLTRGMVLTMFSHFLEAVKENVLPLEGGPKALSSISTVIRGMAGSLGGRPTGQRNEVIEVESGVAD